MVKVTFKPWEEVVIHESLHYSLPDLIKLQSLGVQPGGLARPLRWAEGIVFNASGMPATDEIVREQLEGKVHWNLIQWATMPEYQDVIPIEDINAKIPVINASMNSIICAVAKELKKQLKE